MQLELIIRGRRIADRLRVRTRDRIMRSLERFRHRVQRVLAVLDGEHEAEHRLRLAVTLADGRSLIATGMAEHPGGALGEALAGIRRALAEQSSGLRGDSRRLGRVARGKFLETT